MYPDTRSRFIIPRANMKRFSSVLVIFIIVSMLGIAVARRHAGQRATMTPPQLSSSEELAADIRVEDVRVMEQATAASEWEVSAREAKVYHAEQRTELHTVAALLSRLDESPIHMTAERGHVDGVTGNMAVEGTVRLQYQDGYTIETDKLHWSAADETLYTEAPVAIYNTSVYIAGIGLQSKAGQQRIAIQHHVQASFRLQ
jgi:LPS export ABC transporter protein LptC